MEAEDLRLSPTGNSEGPRFRSMIAGRLDWLTPINFWFCLSSVGVFKLASSSVFCENEFN